LPPRSNGEVLEGFFADFWERLKFHMAAFHLVGFFKF